MKKLVLAVCLAFALTGFAQDQKMSKEDEAKLEQSLKMMLDSKIDMTIDSSVFTVNDGNTYFTEAQDAGIIAMAAPKSFAKMKEDMDKKSEPGAEKGEMTIDGQKILFM